VSCAACLQLLLTAHAPCTCARCLRRGWRVLHVPFFEWAALEGDAAKQQYLEQKLDSIS
jgi:hypothetical protein